MILNFERAPKYSLYFIGAKVLAILKEQSNVTIEDIYQQLQVVYNGDLSISYLYLTLDWLYIIEKINIVDGVVILL